MNTKESTAFVASTTEKESYVRPDLGNLEIKETNCFSLFKCVHIDFPGNQILQATLTKYRKKPVLLEMVHAALNFEASYEELDKLCFIPIGTVSDLCGNVQT